MRILMRMMMTPMRRGTKWILTVNRRASKLQKREITVLHLNVVHHSDADADADAVIVYNTKHFLSEMRVDPKVIAGNLVFNWSQLFLQSLNLTYDDDDGDEAKVQVSHPLHVQS